MFSKDFQVEIHSSRSSARRALASRCAPPSQKDLDLWRNAWNRFSTDSFGQIPPFKCIRISDPFDPDIVKLRKSQYCLRAVKHFLPKFKNKQHLLTGQAANNVRNIIDLLEFWKDTLPHDCSILPPKPVPVVLPTPVAAPQILLPLPPRKKSARIKIVHNNTQTPAADCTTAPAALLPAGRHVRAAGATSSEDEELDHYFDQPESIDSSSDD